MSLPALKKRASAPAIKLRWVLIVALLPLELLGLLAIGVQAYDLVRYEPAYFTAPFLERYAAPADTVRLLERAMQTGDAQLAAELQGLRRPADLPISPSIKFVMLEERTDRYLTYLYVDLRDWVRGRWVVTGDDLAYYLHSGQWRRAFFPASIAWWALGGLGLGLVWTLRTSERFRAWLLRD